MSFDVIHALDHSASLSQTAVRDIVRRAFQAMLGQVSASAAEEAIRSGRADPILDVTKAWGDLADILSEAFDVGGALAGTFESAAHLTAQEAPLASKALDLSVLPDLAAGYLDREGARLVVDVTDATRQAIREIVRSTFTGPVNIQDAARELVGLREFGLSPQGQRSLLLYSADLQQQVEDGDLSQAEMRHLSQVRGEALRRQRGALVARTEAYNAGNAGRRQMYEEAVEQGKLDPDTYVLRWVTRAIHVCPRCEAFRDAIADISGGKFTSRPVDRGSWNGKVLTAERPTLHPGCYCALTSARRSDFQ